MKNWLKVFRVLSTAKDVTIRERIYLLAAIYLALILKRKMIQDHVQHIHSHFIYNGANIVMFASLLSDIPYSISCHGSSDGHGNQYFKWKLSKFGIFVSEYSKRDLVSLIGANALPKTVFIEPMGVDCKTFIRQKPYKPYLGRGTINIFSCGRLSQEKGHGVLISTVGKLIKESISIHLQIAGGELSPAMEYSKYLEQLKKNLNIASHVTLLGPISTERMKKELEQCHLFVLASFNEAFGVVYAEAMAMEVPTIGTLVGGISEIINDGDNGVLVPPNDADSLATAIRKLSNNAESTKKIGYKARRDVETHFSTERSAKALIEGIELNP